MPVYTSLRDVTEFQKTLKENKNIVILRFTASWCAPCKRIEPLVTSFLQVMPEDVEFYNLDVDVNTEVYSFLKTKRRVNGIPAILCYVTGNVSYIPDHFVIGSSSDDINRFFKSCADSYKGVKSTNA
jgi:hypothetical protein